jgi:hypothetical protein
LFFVFFSKSTYISCRLTEYVDVGDWNSGVRCELSYVTKSEKTTDVIKLDNV